MEGRIPKDYQRAVIVPFYKGKSEVEMQELQGISLLSIPGKVYGRTLIERVGEMTEGLIGEEQGGF